MRSGSRICAQRLLRRRSENEFARFSDVSQLAVDERARERSPRRATAASADRLVARGAATATPSRDPDRGERQAQRRSSASAISDDVEPDQAVLELGDHRRRRVAGGALPEPPCTAAMKLTIHVPTVTLSVRIAAVDGCSVIDAVGRRERDRQAGVQQVPGDDGGKLRRVDAAAVARPQHDRGERRAATRRATRPAGRAPSPPMRANGRHRLLQLELQRAALPVARHQRGSRRTAAGTPPPARTR